MTGRLVALLLAVLVVLAAVPGPAPASGTAAAADAASDLRAGRPFVAVLIDQTDRRLLASEAYADWHAYYKRFVASGRGSIPVHTLSPARARLQLPALGKKQGNATLFVNAQGRGLLHDGLVLEPQVYQIGRGFAEGAEASPQAQAYGLKPLGLK